MQKLLLPGVRAVGHLAHGRMDALRLSTGVPRPEHDPREHTVPHGALFDDLPGGGVCYVHRHASVMRALVTFAPDAAPFFRPWCLVIKHRVALERHARIEGRCSRQPYRHQ